MSGKGSLRRPTQIDDKTAEDNWNRIFGKKKESESCSETNQVKNQINQCQVKKAKSAK